MNDTPTPPDGRPEFGPSGYLPERASKRARKIVLRAPLGLQWPIAAVIAGLAVLVAGVLFLQRDDGPPPAPWVAVGEVDEIGDAQAVEQIGDAQAVDDATEALVVAAGGRIRVFADAAGVDYCEVSNRLEAADGRVWNLTGRGLGGTPSLSEHPSIVQDGTAYLDPTRTAPAPEPSADAAEPACT